MENEIPQKNEGRLKTYAPAITSPNSMSYLGPFNFRKLLRPVHERNVRDVPQKKRQNIITSSRVVT